MSRSAVSRAPAAAPPRIEVVDACEHNLRHLSAHVPLDALTVVTGVSGSGKSTLAFDILFASGQRRYLDCVSAYARQFVQPQARPDVRELRNLPPTVAIEQRLSRGGWKSTVATVTEIHNDLRLLFLTLGEQRCPDCGVPIEKQSPERIVARILDREDGRDVALLARLVSGRKGNFAPLAAWAARHGHDRLRLDGRWVPSSPWKPADRFREHDVDVEAGSLRVRPAARRDLLELVRKALFLGGGTLRVAPAGGAEYVASTARVCPRCARSFEAPDPRLFSFHSARGRCPSCGGFGVGRVRDASLGSESAGNRRADRRETTFADAVREEEPDDVGTVCPDCGGARLNPEARAFRFHGLGIADFARLTVDEAAAWFAAFRPGAREAAVADGPVRDLRSRLDFLRRVGLGYLTLDRAAPSLSGGEAQRIRLAAQLGSNLRGCSPMVGSSRT